jgi:hypothetical protein
VDQRQRQEGPRDPRGIRPAAPLAEAQHDDRRRNGRGVKQQFAELRLTPSPHALVSLEQRARAQVQRDQRNRRPAGANPHVAARRLDEFARPG